MPWLLTSHLSLLTSYFFLAFFAFFAVAFFAVFFAAVFFAAVFFLAPRLLLMPPGFSSFGIVAPWRPPHERRPRVM